MARAVRTAVVAVAVLATTAGCGLGAALGQAPATTSAAADPGTVAAATSPAPPTAARGPVQVAALPLGGRAGSDQLTVTVGPVQTGLVPPMPNWPESCRVDYAALQYVPVTLGYGRDELAGHLTVSTTAATPADVGPIGVFFDGAAQPYCQDDPPFQPVDTFWSHQSDNRVTAYVVLQDAVTPATPQGRADVFGTLDIRIDHLRVHSGGDVPYTPGTPTVGALCPDDADAVCVPLP
ncbi:hypothetical protein [Klenkia brasiliensis]|uniref:hypothetical protein n=1 Tax=Klenkia brasiliensis TaxID=333142 RepID=UPI0010425F15|nr:hypothetical protein [Klenkia brasiliensis]